MPENLANGLVLGLRPDGSPTLRHVDGREVAGLRNVTIDSPLGGVTVATVEILVVNPEGNSFVSPGSTTSVKEMRGDDA